MPSSGFTARTPGSVWKAPLISERYSPALRASSGSMPKPTRRLASFQARFARTAAPSLSQESAMTLTPCSTKRGSRRSSDASHLRQIGQCSPQ